MGIFTGGPGIVARLLGRTGMWGRPQQPMGGYNNGYNNGPGGGFGGGPGGPGGFGGGPGGPRRG